MMEAVRAREPGQESFASERRFQLWSYTVSHGQLLLRSTKDDDHPTRVDVLFKNVQTINLPASMDGLHIQKVGPRSYQLRGGDWQGHVEASVMVAAEDEGSYLDPSPLYIGGVGGDPTER
jgi:hypothetical protein